MTRLVLVSAMCMTLTAWASGGQQPPPQQPPTSILKVGDTAPEFSLPGTDGKTHKLSDYKGRTVVLAWFPAAFTSG